MHCNIIINATQGLAQRAVEIVLDVVVTAPWEPPCDARPFVSFLTLQQKQPLFLLA